MKTSVFISLITGPAVCICMTMISTKPRNVSRISTLSEGIDTMIKLIVVYERAPKRTPRILPLTPDMLINQSTTAAIAYIS